MSIPRRLGRLARGFVSTLQDDDRFREAVRSGRERGETFKDTFGEAFSAAWRGAAEEWRAAETRHAEEREAHEQAADEHESRKRASENQTSNRTSDRERSWRSTASSFVPRKYPLNVLSAYNRLGLEPGVSIEEVHRKRRELVKRYHPDRFTDPGKRVKAERLTAEINGAHDAIIRHGRR